jgi:hypothetical protein
MEVLNRLRLRNILKPEIYKELMEYSVEVEYIKENPFSPYDNSDIIDDLKEFNDLLLR